MSNSDIMNSTPCEGRSQVTEVFLSVYRTLQSAGLIAEVRPENVGEKNLFEGDVDALYNPKDLDKIFHITLDIIRSQGVDVCIEQTSPRKTQIRFFVTDEDSILLELWPRYELKPSGAREHEIYYLSWKSLTPYFSISGESYTVRADVGALLYIMHLFHKRKSLQKKEVSHRLQEYVSRLKSLHYLQNLERINALLSQLQSGLISLEKANHEAYVLLLSYGFKMSSNRSLWERIKRKTLLFQSRSLSGVVPVVGPDGSGKTTLLDGLCADQTLLKIRFKSFFRNAFVYRRFERLFRSKCVDNNIFDENHLSFVLTVAFMRWHFMLWRMKTIGKIRQGSVWLVDRFFWDYMLRLRQVSRVPRRIGFYGVVSRCLPKPDSSIVLVCDDGLLKHRKDELTTMAIDALYRVYCEQIAIHRIPHVLMLSTRCPIEKSLVKAKLFLVRSRR